MKTETIKKQKYWYRDDIDCCVLCGKEVHHRERVYKEFEKGTVVRDWMCYDHY